MTRVVGAVTLYLLIVSIDWEDVAWTSKNIPGAGVGEVGSLGAVRGEGRHHIRNVDVRGGVAPGTGVVAPRALSGDSAGERGSDQRVTHLD